MASPTMRAGLLSTIAVVAISVAILPMAFGGLYPIDINNSHVQELARWAVSEHVKQANDGIKFNKLVSGNQRVGRLGIITFDLIIDAWNNNGKGARYEALLDKRYWWGKRTLLSFKRLA
ncbi:unnamed protein product [Urochloa decumbens]|uniref:Cystatin domain-containing protein n=1 Tax=Urochloa decumbens TaxID=240449 RepID=A0ABC8VFF8_9POAL